MNRLTRSSLAIVAVLAVFLLAGCQPKVEVKTGERVVCTEGHLITEDIQTIEVPADEIANYKVVTVVQTCPQHSELVALYEDAQKAIAEGDLKTAETNLTKIVASDPAFRKAQTQLDKVKTGEKPAVDNEQPAPPATTDGTNSKPGEGDTSTPAGALLKWAPDNIKGFKATKPIVELLNISREYVPESGTKAVSFVIVAEQAKTAKGAQAALNTQVKQQYPADAETITINGRKVYFGTNGNRFAAIGFTEGAVMVALEMSVEADGSPKTLKSTLTAAAKQLP